MPFSCFLFRPRKSREKRRNRGHTNVSNTLVTRTSTPPAQTATFAFTGESGYTLGFRRKIAHSGLHAETGGVSDGGAITTLGTFRTFTNIPGPGVRTANFAAFGSWLGVLPKNAESLRNSDALMRVAVPRRRGPAGLRDPIAVSLTAPMGFTVLLVHDNSTQRTYLLFHTWVCSMRLATRCRSFALSTASICR